ncbi:MAG: hypothetical protein FVQ79_03640 [Planctomycetes bacterium]|nr:hypothetical protein [Planctomycetota bacterium]
MAKVFLNDKILDAQDAAVPVGDSGLLYGMGLFETMRAASGKVFCLDDHIERLFTSAEKLGIKHDLTKDAIEKAIDEVLTANSLTDSRLRLTLTAGSMSDETTVATLLITATDFTPYPSEYYEKGVRVILCDFRQTGADPLCGHKTTNYFARLMALKKAHEKQAAESLWFTTDNRLAEGCVSNVFIVKDSVLYTPPLTTPVLNGIARRTVCEIAIENRIELKEKDLAVEDLLAADEIFITNVIMLAMPVTSVESHTITEGKPGPVTKQILEEFRKLVTGVK